MTTDTGEEYLVYANWLFNNHLNLWKGWSCQSGAKRIYIDKNLNIYGGVCKNDYLGTPDDFNLLESTVCRRETCVSCTDDLIVEKHALESNTTDDQPRKHEDDSNDMDSGTTIDGLQSN